MSTLSSYPSRSKVPMLSLTLRTSVVTFPRQDPALLCLAPLVFALTALSGRPGTRLVEPAFGESRAGIARLRLHLAWTPHSPLGTQQTNRLVFPPLTGKLPWWHLW